MTSTRIRTFTVEGPTLELYVSDCANCGVVFGIPKDLERRRREDRGSFYCPNGHSLVFGGKSDGEKLREAEARETALRDQLDAAVRDAENVRQALVRDRHRFANGVCPCCNRSFENVRRHMRGVHPDYDLTHVAGDVGEAPFECSCGAEFDTYKGLRIHQGQKRPGDWEARAQSDVTWKRSTAHTTVV